MKNFAKRLLGGWRAGLREAARDQHTNYDTGYFGRNMMWVFQAVLVTAFVVAGLIALAAVSFSAQGWPGLIGQIYASMCINQGVCDLNVLQAAFASGNIVLISLLVLTAVAVERSWAMVDHEDDALYDAVDDIADHGERIIEQNQTLMAMLFMVAAPEIKDRMAELFADTLDDEESKALRDLIEEHDQDTALDAAELTVEKGLDHAGHY